jgi:5'-nucleotidase
MKGDTMDRRAAVLLTNDDGVTSPGLMALKRALDEVVDVEVYAPDRNWSAASRTMTLHKPLRVDQVRLLDGSEGHMTSGTPTDCVSLAMLGLLDPRPQVVVSGINAGLNLGQDVSYSGTVAAAMEGVRSGVPAIAISQDVETRGAEEISYEIAGRFAASLVAALLDERPLPAGTLLNVNVPYVPPGRTPMVRVTRLGGLAYSNYLVKGEDPQGRSYYWIAGDPQRTVPREERDTDIASIVDGAISVTPLHLDMTEHALLGTLRDWQDRPWFDGS